MEGWLELFQEIKYRSKFGRQIEEEDSERIVEIVKYAFSRLSSKQQSMLSMAYGLEREKIERQEVARYFKISPRYVDQPIGVAIVTLDRLIQARIYGEEAFRKDLINPKGNIRLDELGLEVRLFNILFRHQLFTLQDLYEAWPRFRVYGFGKVGQATLKSILQNHGFDVS